MRRFAVRFFAILLSVAVVAVGGGIFWAWDAYRAPGPLDKSVTIIIEKGAGVQDIASKLASTGAIDNAHLFVLGAQYTETARRMRAGEFALEPGMSMRAIADHLVNGETVKRRLTVPEGLLTEEVISLVAATDGLVGDVPVARPDGIYLPETYFFSYGDSRASVLSRMKKAMDDALSEAWASRADKIAISSPREALILASIIERETGVDAERARVAGVFHNRLRRRMRLQSDPTVAYAVTGGGRPLGRSLTRADLYIDSDYNTYRRVGLPPGPIANPGRAAIKAAVQPADTKDLYFVADGTGGHAFARTLREHNRNVAKWRRLQRQRVQ
ncbi:MAG: endolytic transglycosylase MltG [Alphaproteobacteria bacterium]